MAEQKAQKPGRFFLFGIIMIAALIFADQYTKWLVLETMLRTGEARSFQDWFMTLQPIAFFLDQREAYKTVELTSFLNFTMVWNTGVSFGLFNSDSSIVKFFLIGIALMISMFLVIWLSVSKNALASSAIVLIVSGAIGNVIDRVRFGAVADFIDLHVAGFHWPAFNIADSGIVLGGLLLMIYASTSKNENLLWG